MHGRPRASSNGGQFFAVQILVKQNLVWLICLRTRYGYSLAYQAVSRLADGHDNSNYYGHHDSEQSEDFSPTPSVPCVELVP